MQLLVKYAYNVRFFKWNCALWKSSFNISSVLQNVVNMQVLNLNGNETISDIFFLYHRVLSFLPRLSAEAVLHPVSHRGPPQNMPQTSNSLLSPT